MVGAIQMKPGYAITFYFFHIWNEIVSGLRKGKLFKPRKSPHKGSYSQLNWYPCQNAWPKSEVSKQQIFFFIIITDKIYIQLSSPGEEQAMNNLLSQPKSQGQFGEQKRFMAEVPLTPGSHSYHEVSVIVCHI